MLFFRLIDQYRIIKSLVVSQLIFARIEPKRVNYCFYNFISFFHKSYNQFMLQCQHDGWVRIVTYSQEIAKVSGSEVSNQQLHVGGGGTGIQTRHPLTTSHRCST